MLINLSLVYVIPYDNAYITKQFSKDFKIEAKVIKTGEAVLFIFSMRLPIYRCLVSLGDLSNLLLL